MKNLGKATIKVSISNGLPNIVGDRKRLNFDLGAYQWGTLSKSPLFYPLLTDVILDSEEGFGACFPSKRKSYVSNYMAGGQNGNSTTGVLWSVMDAASVTGSFKNIIAKLTKYDSGLVPVDVAGWQISQDRGWVGPVFWDCAEAKIITPDDSVAIQNFAKFYGVNINLAAPPETEKAEIPTTQYIHQATSKEGLWWGLVSNNFVSENMPFWVTINKPKDPPSSEENPSYLGIRFGESDADNTFDIWFGSDLKPRIIDYRLGTSGGSGEASGTYGKIVEFMSDLSRILVTAESIEVGVMVVGGRLVVLVNNNSFVYTRLDSEGSILECKIPAGPVKIMGTNMPITFNLSPMSFSPLAVIPLPVPSPPEGMKGQWSGVNKIGDPSGSVCELPDPYGKKTYGCDCETFSGDGGSASPSGKGFQSKGFIFFNKGSEEVFTELSGKEFYYLVMKSSDGKTGNGVTIPYGGCPYFFRLKGIMAKPGAGAGGGTSLDDYVISAEETASAPDYFHVKKQASVTFYDPNGFVSSKIGLSGQQKGISISWGWGSAQKTFTGVITNVSTSTTPGKETVTATCQDYMYVLDNVLIINSPFYDGMVAYYAVRDLAERAGCNSFIKDWESEEDYFLASGYAYTKPRYRFDSKQKILECMISIVKNFEAYIYFDEEGVLHINKLEGGLFSSSGTAAGTFSSSPNDAETAILGERNVELNYDSTFNCISIITVDRNTRNPILYVKSNNNKVLKYNRVALIDQPALGELDAAKAWAADVSKRLFKPIIKTRFKVAGMNATARPLDFVTVDGQQFRLMSVKRSYNADNNDFTSSFEAEWLGG